MYLRFLNTIYITLRVKIVDIKYSWKYLINCSSTNKYYSFARRASYSLDLNRLTSDKKSFTSFKGWYVRSRAHERRTITQPVIPWPIRGTSVRHVWRLLFGPLRSPLITEMDASSTWLTMTERDDFSTPSSTFCDSISILCSLLWSMHAIYSPIRRALNSFIGLHRSHMLVSCLYRVSYFFFTTSIGNQFF